MSTSAGADPCAYARAEMAGDAAALRRYAALATDPGRRDTLAGMAASYDAARARVDAGESTAGGADAARKAVRDEGFMHGMMAALAVVAAHDSQTQYEEIVDTVGAKDLVLACDDRESAEWCGLVRYGYWSKFARYRPDKGRDPTATRPAGVEGVP